MAIRYSLENLSYVLLAAGGLAALPSLAVALKASVYEILSCETEPDD